MRIHAPLKLACGLAFLVPVLTIGCQPTRGFCQASADCESEFFGVEIPDAAGKADDDVAVCIANQDGLLAGFRANDEEICQEAANALEAYYACVGSEFADSSDGCDAVGEDCENEFQDFQEVQQDINGDECSQNET